MGYIFCEVRVHGFLSHSSVNSDTPSHEFFAREKFMLSQYMSRGQKEGRPLGLKRL